MQAVYCHSPNIWSLVLRTALWSKWSHCGIVMPDKSIIHADSYSGGVVQTSWSTFTIRHTYWEFKDIPLPDDEAAYTFARAQLGKPYDWWGVIGIALHRKWQDDTDWFCSELVEAAAAAGGRQRFINDTWRVNPQHSWMVR